MAEAGEGPGFHGVEPGGEDWQRICGPEPVQAAACEVDCLTGVASLEGEMAHASLYIGCHGRVGGCLAKSQGAVEVPLRDSVTP